MNTLTRENRDDARAQAASAMAEDATSNFQNVVICSSRSG